jgi:hypothetical protein
MAEIGGPMATPSRRVLLKIQVIQPLCCFSIPSVTNASRHGRAAPIPIAVKDRAIINIRKLSKN